MIINNENLTNLISEIDRSIDNIFYLVRSTNNLLESIDEKTWNSVEKKEFDSNINPIISNINNNLYSYLMEPVNLLKNINITYQDVSKDINEKIENLDL